MIVPSFHLHWRPPRSLTWQCTSETISFILGTDTISFGIRVWRLMPTFYYDSLNFKSIAPPPCRPLPSCRCNRRPSTLAARAGEWARRAAPARSPENRSSPNHSFFLKSFCMFVISNSKDRLSYRAPFLHYFEPDKERTAYWELTMREPRNGSRAVIPTPNHLTSNSLTLLSVAMWMCTASWP